MACTISTALDHGDKFLFPKWSYEQYFNIHNCFADSINPTEIYNQPNFHYEKINIENSKNKIVDLRGFFQSKKFFEKHERAIKHALTPINCIKTQVSKTGLHVRRGDYLNFSAAHPSLSLDYYHQAMELIPSEKYVIFSDDINWCKENFRGSQFEFSEGKNEVDDLISMISMENNIIANSSFSWWGAYLNNNCNKKIIAPKTWFGPALHDHDTKDLIPADWITI